MHEALAKRSLQGQGGLPNEGMMLPPQAPEWAILAELAGRSRTALLADPSMFNLGVGAPVWGFLASAGFLSEHTPMPSMPGSAGPDADDGPLLPLPAGWRRIGLLTSLSHRRALPLGDGRMIMAGGLPWILLFDWDAATPAWEALLVTQETIRPDRLSLPPWLSVLLVFLTRMADHATSGEGDKQDPPGKWLDVLPAVMGSLVPLADALYTVWLNGTSDAAGRYRQNVGMSQPKPQDRAGQEAIAGIERIFGPDWITMLRTAERPEPVVLRLFDHAGSALWTAGSPAALAAKPKPPGALQGLLPLGRWLPATQRLPLPIPRSLSDCLRQWQAWLRTA